MACRLQLETPPSPPHGRVLPVNLHEGFFGRASSSERQIYGVNSSGSLCELQIPRLNPLSEYFQLQEGCSSHSCPARLRRALYGLAAWPAHLGMHNTPHPISMHTVLMSCNHFLSLKHLDVSQGTNALCFCSRDHTASQQICHSYHTSVLIVSTFRHHYCSFLSYILINLFLSPQISRAAPSCIL